MKSAPAQSWWQSFARTFARRNLFEKEAKLVSWVIIVITALTTAGTLISITLPFATRRINLERLQANPTARCVWARHRLSERFFDQATLDGLNAHLRKNLVPPDVLTGVFPYDEIEWHWYVANGKGTRSLIGRTLARDDPWYRYSNQVSFLRPGGASFSSEKQSGVIVSPHLLETLKYPKDTPVGTVLKIQSPIANKSVDLPIIGISTEAMPMGHMFIINELERVQIVNADPDISHNVIQTGPIPAGWPEDPNDLDARFVAAYKTWGWMGFDSSRDDKRCYLFRHDSRKPARSEWIFYLKQFHDHIIRDRGGRPCPEFIDAHMAATAEKPKPLPPPEWIAVYVNHPAHLRQTVKALEDNGWVTSEIGIAQLEEASRSFYAAMSALSILAALFGIAAAVSNFLVHVLRARQKAPEIGMMRAMGMPDALVTRIFVVEATILWWRGTALGFLGALVLLGIPALVFLRLDELPAVIIDWGALAAVGYLLFSWLICWCTAVFSTKRWREQAPISSLALTS